VLRRQRRPQARSNLPTFTAPSAPQRSVSCPGPQCRRADRSQSDQRNTNFEKFEERETFNFLQFAQNQTSETSLSTKHLLCCDGSATGCRLEGVLHRQPPPLSRDHGLAAASPTRAVATAGYATTSACGYLRVVQTLGRMAYMASGRRTFVGKLRIIWHSYLAIVVDPSACHNSKHGTCQVPSMKHETSGKSMNCHEGGVQE
jgi:hypothetical protein